jgi:hypothetical protein
VLGEYLMEIKTMYESSLEELDTKCNDFGKKHKVRATQTQTIFDVTLNKMMHKAVLFYDE